MTYSLDIVLKSWKFKSEKVLRMKKEPNALAFALSLFGEPWKGCGWVTKKTHNHPKTNEQERTNFQSRIKACQSVGKPIIYIDESGFAHDMPRTHGYASKRDRCYGKQDWGAKGRTNVIGALLGKTLLCVCLLNYYVDS